MKIDFNREQESPGPGQWAEAGFSTVAEAFPPRCNGQANVHYDFTLFGNASVSRTAEGGGV